ncbi:MAG: carboxylating nicotinate-nucleotide diphosphorylase [Planctomycetes bacterium]|nr:carboxylating nicotinate-nucleotide diphosphorylase [Planctomycetota bacterium]NUQ36022.1 carboxylating nicotinate-nucleotide diphosphorylase [Planctomycetaceae bacterium]
MRPDFNQVAKAALDSLDRAIFEDCGEVGDITSDALPLGNVYARGTLLCKAQGVIAGVSLLPELCALKRLPDAQALEATVIVKDASVVSAGTIAATIEGPARSLLVLERPLLNLLSRLSGIASLTARFVERVSGSGVAICETRKTTPGLRTLEKYAVVCGGGTNHRYGLYDELMVKENHLMLGALSISETVAELRSAYPTKRLTLEVENLQQLEEALGLDIDCIMLDDFSTKDVERAVALRGRTGRTSIIFEISGGVTIDNVSALAKLGVERISVGALTHSAKALDMSFKLTR